jgi:hypothetical protein
MSVGDVAIVVVLIFAMVLIAQVWMAAHDTAQGQEGE